MADRYGKLQAGIGLAGLVAFGGAIALAPHSPVLILSVGALAVFCSGCAFFAGYRATAAKRTLQLSFAVASWAVATMLLWGAWFISQQVAVGYVPG